MVLVLVQGPVSNRLLAVPVAVPEVVAVPVFVTVPVPVVVALIVPVVMVEFEIADVATTEAKFTYFIKRCIAS